MSTVDAFKFARIAARAADEKIGEDILAFDVRRESTLADCYLLVTGSGHIHIRAIEDAIRESLREAGADLRRTDGQRGHMWRALDYGSLIVHIMDQKTREFYAMEKLWERGKRIDWSGKEKPARSPRRVATRRKLSRSPKYSATKPSRRQPSSRRKPGSRS